MKVGVIGAGYWGKKHVEEYRALGLEVCVSDILESNLKTCQQKYGAEIYKDYESLLKNPEIFAVSVCTPNNTHYKIAKDALLAGKHVMIEKPMVMTIDDAAEIIETARKADRNVGVGYLFRFNNAVNYAKSEIEKKNLGEIYALHFKWTNLEPIWEDRDIIFDLGAHPVDTSLYLLGNRLPKAVYANGDGFRQKNEEMAIINYHIGSTLVNIDSSWVNPLKVREIIVNGSKKTLQINALEQIVKCIDNESRTPVLVKIEPSNTIRDELASFLEQCKANGNRTKAAEAGRDVIKVLQTARLSIMQKRYARLLNET